MNIEMDWSTNQRDSNGKKQGLWRDYYENGDLNWECNYVDGDLSGLYRTWHLSDRWHFNANGYLASEGMHVNGMYNGFRKSWDRLGHMSLEQNFVNGVQEGEEIKHIYD